MFFVVGTPPSKTAADEYSLVRGFCGCAEMMQRKPSTTRGSGFMFQKKQQTEQAPIA